MATISHVVITEGGDYPRRPTVTLKGAAKADKPEASARGDDKESGKKTPLQQAAEHGFFKNQRPAQAAGKREKTTKLDGSQKVGGDAENVNEVEGHEETDLDRAAHGRGPNMQITDYLATQDHSVDAEASMVGRKVVAVELRKAKGREYDGAPEVVFDPPGARAYCVMNDEK